ncbi:MAG: hypothetical protein Tsb004_16120 [Allomuricauda sp.]
MTIVSFAGLEETENKKAIVSTRKGITRYTNSFIIYGMQQEVALENLHLKNRITRVPQKGRSRMHP